MCEMLAQEPWCFHPDQIAAMTDWQIENLHARPAVERAKRFEEERVGQRRTPMDDCPIPPLTLPEMGEVVGVYPDGTQRIRNTDMSVSHNPGRSIKVGTTEFREWVIGQFMTMGLSRTTAEMQYEEQATTKG